jgi:hypothetical protein
MRSWSLLWDTQHEGAHDLTAKRITSGAPIKAPFDFNLVKLNSPWRKEIKLELVDTITRTFQ